MYDEERRVTETWEGSTAGFMVAEKSHDDGELSSYVDEAGGHCQWILLKSEKTRTRTTWIFLRVKWEREDAESACGNQAQATYSVEFMNNVNENPTAEILPAL